MWWLRIWRARFWSGRKCARDLVNDAKGAEGVAIGRDERGAGVEADFGVGNHKRVVGETFVLGGVRDDEQFLARDGMAAEGDVAGGFVDGDADLGFEPLAFFINEGDERDGGFTDAGGEFGEVVKNLFGNGVEDFVLPEHFEPLFFVFGNGSRHRLCLIYLPVKRWPTSSHTKGEDRRIFQANQLLFWEWGCLDSGHGRSGLHIAGGRAGD